MVVQIQLPTFDAESKSAKIQKSHFCVGWGQCSYPTFRGQLQTFKPKFQTEIFISRGQLGGSDPTFKSQLQNFKPKSQAEISISGMGEGLVTNGMHGIWC